MSPTEKMLITLLCCLHTHLFVGRERFLRSFEIKSNLTKLSLKFKSSFLSVWDHQLLNCKINLCLAFNSLIVFLSFKLFFVFTWQVDSSNEFFSFSKLKQLKLLVNKGKIIPSPYDGAYEYKMNDPLNVVKAEWIHHIHS